MSNYLPALRPDVQIIPTQFDGQEVLYIHDSMGYASEALILKREAESLLSCFSGTFKRSLLEQQVKELGQAELLDVIDELMETLDNHYLLDSEKFRQFKQSQEQEYEEQAIHEAVCAGNSYPSTKEEIVATFDSAFSESVVTETVAGIDDIYALYAPHIDLRVAMDTYVRSFAPLKNIAPKHIYLVGTSHYSGYHGIYDQKPFIISEKSYRTPLGTVENNQEKTRALYNQIEHYGATLSDRAQRNEHSLELHLILLQYLWNHEFTITPVLVGSLDELHYTPDSAKQIYADKFSAALHDAVGEEDLILISGDLSHIGRKFGDQEPGMDVLDRATPYDQQFLNAGEAGNPDALKKAISPHYDQFRVCGFPPLYAFLASRPENLIGKELDYQFWDEQERESVVSFGSILYSNPPKPKITS